MPVMEGKAVLFKSFAGVDAVPLCLNSRSVDDICQTVEMLEPGFGGINLEAIKAAGLPTITPVLICNTDDYPTFKTHVGTAVTNADLVIELGK